MSGKLLRVEGVIESFGGGLFGVVESKVSTWRVQADGHQVKHFYGTTRAKAIEAYKATTGFPANSTVKAVEIPRPSQHQHPKVAKMSEDAAAREQARQWVANNPACQRFLKMWRNATPEQRNWKPRAAAESLEATARRLRGNRTQCRQRDA